MDINTLLSLPKLHLVEYILLTGALLISFVGYFHQFLHLNAFTFINSNNLRGYAWFVRTQMFCALAMLSFMIPAIVIGVINGAENLVTALSFYAAIFIFSKIFGRMEKKLKSVKSDDPEIQEQIEDMVYQWDKKAFPTF